MIDKTGVEGAIDILWDSKLGAHPTCHETITRNAERIGAEAYIGIFSYAGMPWQEAERNMKCFTDHVMPSLQSRSITGNIAWAA